VAHPRTVVVWCGWDGAAPLSVFQKLLFYVSFSIDEYGKKQERWFKFLVQRLLRAGKGWTGVVMSASALEHRAVAAGGPVAPSTLCPAMPHEVPCQ
jgi:hypothetical protein